MKVSKVVLFLVGHRHLEDEAHAAEWPLKRATEKGH